MNEERYRINKTTATMMVITAGFFELAQLATKILYFAGATILGAAGGAILGAEAAHSIGLGEETAAAVAGVVGGLAGVVLTFLGVGVFVGIAMAYVLSVLLTMIGYATLWLWLLMRGVPILSGKKMGDKFGTFFVSLIFESLPFLNALPGLSFWTIRMIVISRKEDRAKIGAKIGRVSSKRIAQRVENKRRRQKQNRVSQKGRRVAANDNEPFYAEEQYAA